MGAVGPEQSTSIIRAHRAALLLVTYVAPRFVLESASERNVSLTLESLEEAYQRYKQDELETPRLSDPTGPIAVLKMALASPNSAPKHVESRRRATRRKGRPAR